MRWALVRSGATKGLADGPPTGGLTDGMGADYT